MSDEIKEVKTEILPDEQDFYIPVELWESNFFSVGTAYKTLQQAKDSYTNTKHLRKFIKFTLKVEDFK